MIFCYSAIYKLYWGYLSFMYSFALFDFWQFVTFLPAAIARQYFYIFWPRWYYITFKGHGGRLWLAFLLCSHVCELFWRICIILLPSLLRPKLVSNMFYLFNIWWVFTWTFLAIFKCCYQLDLHWSCPRHHQYHHQ